MLLYRHEDKRLQSYFLGGKYPRREESLRVIQALRATSEPRGVPLAELATLADTPLKRTKVIVAQLEGCSIVARRRERVVLVRDFQDAAELESVLAAYEERHRSDRERLEAMIRYGQNALCRMQYIREYFAEPAGEPCARCDNCVAPVRVPTPPPPRARAPVELEVRPALPFVAGQNVRHRKFGVGEVVSVDDSKVSVTFAAHGVKRLDPRYLLAAGSRAPALAGAEAP